MSVDGLAVAQSSLFLVPSLVGANSVGPNCQTCLKINYDSLKKKKKAIQVNGDGFLDPDVVRILFLFLA